MTFIFGESRLLGIYYLTMNATIIRYREKWLLLIFDFIALNIAYCATYALRFSSGWFDNPVSALMIKPSLVISLFWMALFALRGQYRPLFGMSRFDSLWRTITTTGLGILLIYLLLTLDNEPLISKGKVTLLVYWALLVFFAGGARVILRTIQHHLIVRGIALSPTLIVGFNDRGKKLLDQILRFPTMGFKVAGFIDEEANAGDAEYRGVKVIDKIDELEKIIPDMGIMEVLIALRQEQEELTEKVIGITGRTKSSIKIMPEIQQMIYGYVKTASVYGMPLIDVFPHPMKSWEMHIKRIIDILFSFTVLLLSLPLTIIVSIIIKLDSKGPIVYSQKRVGKGGKEFTIHKFRSMVQDAEKKTGAKWAEKNDPRVTRVGKFLRISRIDEIPQFFNVLNGTMSLVGPRPERKYFVDQFINKIPLYSRRHFIKPGITGYGQLRGIYDASLEDVKTRLSLDMQYINNMSIGLDIKILWQTVFLVLRGTGQ